jgi:hypothetical protein
MYRRIGRRRGLAILIGTVSALTAAPAAAQTDNPLGNGGLVDRANGVVGNAEQQVGDLGSKTLGTPKQEPGSGNKGSGAPAGPKAPKRTSSTQRGSALGTAPAGQSEARPHQAVGARASASAGGGSGGGAAPNAHAAKAPEGGSASAAQSSDPTTAPEAVGDGTAKPAGHSDGSPVSLPFTGWRPLWILGLGLAAVLMGLGLRRGVHDRTWAKLRRSSA